MVAIGVSHGGWLDPKDAMTFNLDVLKNPWFNDFLFLVTISPDS